MYDIQMKVISQGTSIGAEKKFPEFKVCKSGSFLSVTSEQLVSGVSYTHKSNNFFAILGMT